MKIEKSDNLVLIGPPGSGKGSQRQKIEKTYRLVALEMGSILRQLSHRQTQIGKKVKTIINAGKFIPDKLTMEVATKFISKLAISQGIIFDGIPRTVTQYHELEKLCQESGRQFPIAILIEVNNATITKRIASRRQCESCGEIYAPPKSLKLEHCEKCGGPMTMRADDNLKVIQHRIKIYQSETKPVIKLFEKHHRLIKVDGEPSVEKVWLNVQQAIERFGAQKRG